MHSKYTSHELISISLNAIETLSENGVFQRTLIMVTLRTNTTKVYLHDATISAITEFNFYYQEAITLIIKLQFKFMKSSITIIHQPKYERGHSDNLQRLTVKHLKKQPSVIGVKIITRIHKVGTDAFDFVLEQPVGFLSSTRITGSRPRVGQCHIWMWCPLNN